MTAGRKTDQLSLYTNSHKPRPCQTSTNRILYGAAPLLLVCADNGGNFGVVEILPGAGTKGQVFLLDGEYRTVPVPGSLSAGDAELSRES